MIDDDQLAGMSQEIAALLVKYLPKGKTVALSGELVQMKSHTRVQIFGSNAQGRAVFSINAILRHPLPSDLNVKCITHNDD